MGQLRRNIVEKRKYAYQKVVSGGDVGNRDAVLAVSGDEFVDTLASAESGFCRVNNFVQSALTQLPLYPSWNNFTQTLPELHKKKE